MVFQSNYQKNSVIRKQNGEGKMVQDEVDREQNIEGFVNYIKNVGFF